MGWINSNKVAASLLSILPLILILLECEPVDCGRKLRWDPVNKLNLTAMESHGHSAMKDELFYVGRAAKDSGQVLGYYRPNLSKLFVGNQEGKVDVIKKDDTKLLNYYPGTVKWVQPKGGEKGGAKQTPADLVFGGLSRRDSMNMFICRGTLNGNKITGYFMYRKPSVCTVPYNKEEVELKDFELLVYTKKGIYFGTAT